MNNEDFVSYETAVKLKELGFDWECHEFWDTSFCVDGTPTKIRYVYGDHKFKVCVVSERNSTLEQMGSDFITAPTMAKAQKWLREVKDCIIVIYPSADFYDCNDVVKPFLDGKWFFELWVKAERISLKEAAFEDYTTYEYALSAGIEAALKLIEEGEV